MPRSPQEQEKYELAQTTLRIRLPETLRRPAVERGESLSLEQGVTFALATVTVTPAGRR